VTAQTIITESYPVAKRGMAQAMVWSVMGSGPLGGYIVDHFSCIFLYQHPNWDYCHIKLSFVKSPNMEIN
jgi:DHA2 family multidrug resistance protein